MTDHEKARAKAIRVCERMNELERELGAQIYFGELLGVVIDEKDFKLYFKNTVDGWSIKDA